MQDELNNKTKKRLELTPLSFRFGKIGIKVFARFIILPGLSGLFKNTFLGACHHVSQKVKQGQSKEAIEFLMERLKSEQFRATKTFRWWYLMRQAITLAQDYQLGGYDPLRDHVKILIDLTKSGPLPRTGYDAAYCFVGLGLWSFQFGDMVQAIAFVREAIEADDEWGYPEYLMGWLGLLDEHIDPIPHFVNALQFNWSFFHRMNRDPICQQHPEIIRQVRQQVLLMTDQASSQRSGHFKK